MARLGSGTTTDTTSTSNELYYAGEAFRLAYDVGAGTGSRRTQTSFIGYQINAKAIAVEVTGGDASTAVPLGQCVIDGVTTTTTRANCTGTWTQGATVDLIPGDSELDISVRDGRCLSNNVDIELASLANEATCLAKGACVAADSSRRHDQTAGTCVAGETFDSYEWEENTQKAQGIFYIYIPSTLLREVGFTEAPQPGSPLYIAYSIDYTEADDDSGDEETRVVETDVIGFRWTPMFDITA